jgi:hypothetical protein
MAFIEHFEMASIIYLLFLLGLADSCFEKGQVQEYGVSCSCLWRQGCGWPDPWCAGIPWVRPSTDHVLGEEKYNFIENLKNPHSCSRILIKV